MSDSTHCVNRRSALLAGALAASLPVFAGPTPPQRATPSLVEPSPKPVNYAQLGLPHDWEPRWETEDGDDFSRFLFALTYEVWHRTEEKLHNAAIAEAELAREQEDSHHTELRLELAQSHELFRMAEQAALLGWALTQTM